MSVWSFTTLIAGSNPARGMVWVGNDTRDQHTDREENAVTWNITALLHLLSLVDWFLGIPLMWIFKGRQNKERMTH